MFPSGYYQTNIRALRFREIVRMVGLRKAFTTYLVTRFKRPQNGTWMPSLWGSLECRQEDLSEYIWQGTKPHRADFEKLGFAVCRYSKITKSLNPNLRDSGGMVYLDSSRRFVAHLIYHQLYVPAKGSIRNIIVVAFTAVFEHSFIYQQFLSHVHRRRDQPREFPTLESLRCWFDDRQVKRFEERVRRRLFVPMTAWYANTDSRITRQLARAT